MSDNLFIGDLHLGHRSILKYRTSFSSIEDQNAARAAIAKATAEL